MGFRSYGLPLMELIMEGNIGLMQAVKKFNPELGFRLSTYAVWWIKASIKDYILRSWSCIRVGTTQAQKKTAAANLRQRERDRHFIRSEPTQLSKAPHFQITTTRR